jgi:hypothetical protein
MTKKTKTSTDPSPRPYFLPEGLQWEKLPASIQAAFEQILSPSYARLVVEPTDPLEQSAGVTAVFLEALEIVDQIDIGQQLFKSPSDASRAEARDKAIARHLRLVGPKQRALGFISRLREQRLRRGPLGYPEPNEKD